MNYTAQDIEYTSKSAYLTGMLHALIIIFILCCISLWWLM